MKKSRKRYLLIVVPVFFSFALLKDKTGWEKEELRGKVKSVIVTSTNKINEGANWDPVRMIYKFDYQ